MVFLDGLSAKVSFIVIYIDMRLIKAARSANAPLELSFPRVTGSIKSPLAFSFLAQVS